jgi:hypothetical protein
MKIRTSALTLVLLFFLPLVRSGSSPGTGITGSAHDFSGEPAGGAITGVCTYCHTPHRSIKNSLLWNHTLPSTDYTWGNYTQTSGGTPLPTISSSWEGPTRFCLSCHDGTVAIGDVGWFNKQPWEGANALDDKTVGVSQPFSIRDFLRDRMMDTNHPVAAPYPFQQAVNTYNGVTTGPAVPVQDYNPDPTPLGIRLFNQQGQSVSAGPVPGNTGFECTSCHGVHNERGIVVDNRLLRGERGDGSGSLCEKCHPNN